MGKFEFTNNSCFGGIEAIEGCKELVEPTTLCPCECGDIIMEGTEFEMICVCDGCYASKSDQVKGGKNG